MNFLFSHNGTLKIILCLIFFGFFSSLFSQTKYYKVTYYISEIKLHGSIDNLDEKGKRFTEQVINRAKDVNYILTTSKEYSYFESENVLSKVNEYSQEHMQLILAKRFASFNEKVYSNFKKDSIVFFRNLGGQDYVVKRKGYVFNWKIKKETKKILGYDAMKAEGRYFDIITKEDFVVEAWFIPTIPIQSGPDIFMGLPGLIAEVNLKGAVVTVDKIEPLVSVKIKKVDESKAMTQQEFESLVGNLNKKMENYIED
ncbi:GLPGLI family protein [Xanthomarina sp. F2636L]|uniref:GLPGLI family protein n=1 Tax=Xanthomarina sp. F2636L TaxID=2996018 RepID=UPI00225DCFE6|nr:GLPGLI family protein [Xanthomarina sp. F2636L]MCX7551394.1 GLPGLI family protein [Xanthomarina sp. F2636L]